MHFIEFVGDDALPEGHDWVLVEVPGGVGIFYRASAVTPRNLEDSWAAFRALQPSTPQQPKPMPVEPALQVVA